MFSSCLDFDCAIDKQTIVPIGKILGIQTYLWVVSYSSSLFSCFLSGGVFSLVLEVWLGKCGNYVKSHWFARLQAFLYRTVLYGDIRVRQQIRRGLCFPSRGNRNSAFKTDNLERLELSNGTSASSMHSLLCTSSQHSLLRLSSSDSDVSLFVERLSPVSPHDLPCIFVRQQEWVWVKS